MKKLASLSFILGFLIIFFSCNNEPQKDDDSKKDSLAVKDTSNTNQLNSYKIPPPVDLYVFLKDAGCKFNKNLLNSLANKDKYTQDIKKAQAFGIYASDMAYCSFFGQNQHTINYYAAVKKLADDLGFLEGFDENITKRVDKNINNADSLYNITKEAYWKAYSWVEENDSRTLLPHIVVSSWVESIYIAYNSVEKFSDKNDVVLRIVDQRLVLETLIDYLESVKDKSKLNDIIAQLKDMLVTFKTLDNNKNGVVITKEQFAEIGKKVTELRNRFINN